MVVAFNAQPGQPATETKGRRRKNAKADTCGVIQFDGSRRTRAQSNSMLQDSMWHTVWGVCEHEFVNNLGAACAAQFPAYAQLADVLLANAYSNVRGAADAIALFTQEQYCGNKKELLPCAFRFPFLTL